MRKFFLLCAFFAALFAALPKSLSAQKNRAATPLVKNKKSSSLKKKSVVQKKSPPFVANLYWSCSCFPPQNFDGNLAADSDFAFSHGVKLNWDALDFRLFNSCKKTPGADFWLLNSFESYENIFCKRRYGLCLDFSKFNENLELKAMFGSLKLYSQKRIAPFSAAASPFAFSLFDCGSLTASLPTKSSSPQDDAIFLSASVGLVEKFSSQEIRFLPIKTEFAICKNEREPQKAPLFFGARGGFYYMNFLKISGGLLYSRYYYEEESFCALDWIEEIPVKKSALRDTFSADFFAEIPGLKSRTTFSSAQGNDADWRFSIAEELLFSAKSFSLSAAFWANDNFFYGNKSPYIAANAKEYKKNWQAKVTPQFSFNLKNKSLLKVGAGAFLEEQTKDFSKKTERKSLEARFALGMKVASKKDSFKVTASLAPLVLAREPLIPEPASLPKISGTFLYSRSFGQKRPFRVNLSGGATFEPNWDWEKKAFSQRLRISVCPRIFFVSSLSVGLTARQEMKKSAFSPSAAAAFLVKTKNLRLNASLSLLATFCQE